MKETRIRAVYRFPFSQPSVRKRGLTAQDADFKWFLEHDEKLFRKYGACCLVIKNGEVLGLYDLYVDGVCGSLKTEEPDTFIVQKYDGSEDAYTACVDSCAFA